MGRRCSFSLRVRARTPSLSSGIGCLEIIRHHSTVFHCLTRSLTARSALRVDPFGRRVSHRDHSGPQVKGSVMSDKSPRQAMAKKSGKSLKEKRAAKHAKADQ